MTVVLARARRREVVSYVYGTHMPTPYAAADGLWRCHDCGRRLRTYVCRGVLRLRHYWRDR